MLMGFMVFEGRDDPHRMFEPAPHGPARRSTPAIDAAQRKLMRHPFTLKRSNSSSNGRGAP